MGYSLKRVASVVWAAVLVLTLAPQAHAVDGIKLINQAKAVAGGVTSCDTPGFPVTICTSGSYRLSGNLALGRVDADNDAIHITADNVTLDLNGFTIFGPGRPGRGDGGFGVFAVQSNVTVVNGSVRNMGGHGIALDGNNHRVENVYATANKGSGIRIGPNSTVKNCTAVLNARESGIFAGPGSTISGNTSNSNILGIVAHEGSTVVGNTARNNASSGLMMAANTGYANNVLTGNNGGDANPQTGGGGLQTGGNVCGTALCR